jgi:hypothetical protein
MQISRARDAKIMPTPSRLPFKKNVRIQAFNGKTNPFYPKMRGLQMEYTFGQVKND